MMSDDTPYAGLADEHGDEHRWAFGTGFSDPLEGIDTTVPSGVDAQALAAYCLALGDDALLYSHRLQQWMTRMPELEEEAAIANIALDLLGQARMLLTRAGRAEARGRDEDKLAYFRGEHEFRNVRLAEREAHDFADLMGGLLIFATWRLAIFEALQSSHDQVLAAIAAKGAKELAYHRDYAAQWVVRLGDGTEQSRTRMQAALDRLWPFVDELFTTDATVTALPGVAVDPAALRAEVDVVLDTVLATATLTRPEVAPVGLVSGKSGRDGVHTEALGYVLAELQSIPRTYPEAKW